MLLNQLDPGLTYDSETDTWGPGIASEADMWNYWNILGGAAPGTAEASTFEDFIISGLTGDNTYNQGVALLGGDESVYDWGQDYIGAFTPFIESTQFIDWQGESTQNWDDWSTQSKVYDLQSQKLRTDLFNQLDYTDAQGERDMRHQGLKSVTEKKLNEYSRKKVINEPLI